MDMTDKDAVALQLSKDGRRAFASQEYRFAILSAQHEKSKMRGVPLLYAGAVMLRFVEGLRVNAGAAGPVPFLARTGIPVRVSLSLTMRSPMALV